MTSMIVPRDDGAYRPDDFVSKVCSLRCTFINVFINVFGTQVIRANVFGTQVIRARRVSVRRRHMSFTDTQQPITAVLNEEFAVFALRKKHEHFFSNL
jgi:hypothetical protein